MFNDDERFELENLLVQNRRKEKIKKEHVDIKWIVKIIIIAFVISFSLSFVSQITIPKLNVWLGVLVTLLFIIIGIVFDIIGVAVNCADEKVFHSMNARQVRGAKVAVKFKKNADKVSSFCNDVVGDICGIVSGSTGAVIAIKITELYNFNNLLVTLIVMGVISSLTIGGKALEKGYAMKKSNKILFGFAKTLSIFCKE